MKPVNTVWFGDEDQGNSVDVGIPASVHDNDQGDDSDQEGGEEDYHHLNKTPIQSEGRHKKRS